MFSNTISKKTFTLLVLKMIRGVGAATIWRAGDIPHVEKENIRDILAEVYKPHAKITDEMIDEAVTEANLQIMKAYQYSDVIISYLDESFPPMLKEDPKKKVPILFCRGDISLLQREMIAVIGTRSPTEHGKAKAKLFTSMIAKSGKVILSGLASGIDTVAHSTTLSMGADTIAVIGTGLERVYPRENAELSLEIGRKGLLITDKPYKDTVSNYDFVLRDYTQAALSKSLVLIQTGIKGGSLHATKAMLGLKRPVFVALPSEEDIRKYKDHCAGNMLLLRKDVGEIKEMLGCKDVDTNLIRVI